MIAGSVQQVAVAADPRFAAAHRALVGDSSVQFDLRRVPPDPKPPQWLHDFGHWLAGVFRPVGQLLAWITNLMPNWPYARIFLWGVLLLIAAAIVWVVVERVRSGVWRLPRRRSLAPAQPGEDEWHPDDAPVRAWLKEADALAERGHYAEAVHHLLFRSIEDIERRRPRLVRPALTSRDIAAADSIPPRARTIFAGIARLVERSLFGGRPLGLDDWTSARASYADFALAKAWSA